MGGSGRLRVLARRLRGRIPRPPIVIVACIPLSWYPSEDARLSYLQFHLSYFSQLRSVCAKIKAEVGHPTVLVSNAGVCRGFGVYEDMHADSETTQILPFISSN